MRYIVMAIVMALTCLNLSTAQAEATTGQRESLRELSELVVVIEKISPDAQADGLSEEPIRAAVELILRSGGIRVLTLSEKPMTPSSPYLYVQVNTYKNEFLYAVNVRVELDQQITLVHRPQYTMAATTWTRNWIGVVGQTKMREVISSIIEPQVKEFANDFLAVNPR
jgi:hypothetical protein